MPSYCSVVLVLDCVGFVYFGAGAGVGMGQGMAEKYVLIPCMDRTGRDSIGLDTD